MPLITKKLIEKAFQIKKAPHDASLLYHLLSKPKLSATVIDQLGFLFDYLPEKIKNDSQFVNRIQCLDKQSTFFGAFEEMASYWIFNTLGYDVGFGSLVGSKTPDLHLKSPIDMPIEVFTLGESIDDREFHNSNRLIRNELKGLRGPRGISIKGTVTLNEHKNIYGLGDKIVRYLSTPGLDCSGTHRVEYRGAAVFFEIFDWGVTEGPIFTGGVSDVISGDSYPQILVKKLNAKLNKYKFPFLGVCFSNHPPPGGIRTIVDAMVGEEVIKIPVNMNNGEMERDSSVENRGNGFWSPKNLDRKNTRLRIGALFVVSSTFDIQNRIIFSISMIENPFNNAKWSDVFTKIPDIAQFQGSSYILNKEPLRLTPLVGVSS